MMTGDTAVSAFQASAGVAPDELSLVIRTVLFVSVCIWGGYLFFSILHHVRLHGLDEMDMLRKFFGVVMVVTVTAILVYTG